MNYKTLSIATAESLANRPESAELIINNLRKIVNKKYRSLSWPRLLKKIIKQVALNQNSCLVEIVSTGNLGKNQISDIKYLFDTDVNILHSRNKNIIGGYILKANNRVLDISVKTKIEKIKANIKAV